MAKKFKLEDLFIENEDKDIDEENSINEQEVIEDGEEDESIDESEEPQPINESEKSLFNRLVENFIPNSQAQDEEENKEILNESLSRGSLYRKKYYGRY